MAIIIFVTVWMKVAGSSLLKVTTEVVRLKEKRRVVFFIVFYLFIYFLMLAPYSCR